MGLGQGQGQGQGQGFCVVQNDRECKTSVEELGDGAPSEHRNYY